MFNGIVRLKSRFLVKSGEGKYVSLFNDMYSEKATKFEKMSQKF